MREAANLGVARPPLVYSGSRALGVILHFAWPVSLLPRSVRPGLGAAVVLLAIGLFLCAVRTFQAAGTPVPGNRATTTIVRTGPYRFSRNPLYLAFSLLQLGIALLRTGHPEGALAAYRNALALREGLMRDDAKNVQAPHDVASALMYIGEAENRMRNYPQAIASLERAIPLTAQTLNDRDGLKATIVSELADAFDGSGRLPDALRMRRQALDQDQRG